MKAGPTLWGYRQRVNPDRYDTEQWASAAKAADLLSAIEKAPSLNPATMTALRRRWPAPTIGAAIDIVAARRSAAGRLDSADTLIADAAGAQQATPWRLAMWKAKRMATMCPQARVVDLGCGIGADARALARHAGVRAIEASEARAWMARTYAAIDVQVATATDGSVEQGEILHLDSSRRTVEGRRLRDPQHWTPPLSMLQQVWADQLTACVMVGPGIRRSSLHAPSAVQWTFCSIDGHLTDAAVWSGALVSSPESMQALALRGDDVLTCSGPLGHPPGGPLPVEGQFLHVPDPALERARLLHLLSETDTLWEPAPGLGLLVGDAPSPSPWCTPWLIHASVPPRPKTLQRWLAANDGGPVTLRTRGGAQKDVDGLARTLSGHGSTPWTVFVLRFGRQKRAFMTAPAR